MLARPMTEASRSPSAYYPGSAEARERLTAQLQAVGPSNWAKVRTGRCSASRGGGEATRGEDFRKTAPYCLIGQANRDLA
jgi:hypothetical protein